MSDYTPEDIVKHSLKGNGADVKDARAPIGWALLGKLFKMTFKSSSTNDSLCISI